jgi:hypothetical protein
MSTPTDRPRVGRPLLIFLAVVAAAAVACLAVVMLGSFDQEAAVSSVGASEALPGLSDGTEAAAPGDAVANATEAPSEVAAVEPTFEVFDARDPFEQLVADDAGGGGATVGTTQPTANTTPTDGQPVDGSQPTSATPPAPDQNPSQTTVGATTILLDDVFTEDGVDKALVVVDSDGYEAAEGDTVAGKVTVLDIAGSCATMRFEDKRFILCEGEQIQK